MFSTTLTSPLRNMRVRGAPSPYTLPLTTSIIGSSPSPNNLPGVLKNVYYLDDPTDGVTPYLLSQMGCRLEQGGLGLPSTPMTQLGLWVTSVHSEHSFPFPSVLSSEQGGVAVDVRDPGDAWVRVVLHEGDILRVGAGVWHRALRAPLSPSDISPAAALSGGDAGQSNSTTALAPHLAGRLTLPGRAGLLLLLQKVRERV